MINPNYSIKKFNNKKWKLLIIDNAIEHLLYEKINKENIKLSKKKNSKFFYLKSKVKKREFLDYKEFYYYQKKIINFLSSKYFIKFIKKELEIKAKLYPDKSKMFSGFTFANKGDFLKPHIDFSYNNKLNKYRYINLLLYFNDKWLSKDGGLLSFYKKNSKNKVKTIIPIGNRIVIFTTNKFTIHGFNKVKTNRTRKALNFYYYVNENLNKVSPHKTIWL